MRTVHIETLLTYAFDIDTLSFIESMLFPSSYKLNMNISEFSFIFDLTKNITKLTKDIFSGKTQSV